MTSPDPSPPDPSLSGLGAPSDIASGAGTDSNWSNLPTCPSDVLLESIVAFLAPSFVGSTTDPGLARLAAIETFASYHARTQGELVSIAQIIGLGLAAMDNLRLAMLPDLSLAMKLRLRASANALNRSARQTLHALEGRRRGNLSVRPGVASGPEERPVGPAGADHETAGAGDRAGVAGAGGAVMADRPSAPVVERTSVAQSAVAGSGLAPALAVPPTVPAAAQSASSQSGSIQRGPIQSASTQPAAARASRALRSSCPQADSLLWADAMTKVASELNRKGGSALARPRSKSDLMWADTLASVAFRLTGGCGGTPDAFEASQGARNLGYERERGTDRHGE
jgi:hypothetical protein